MIDEPLTLLAPLASETGAIHCRDGDGPDPKCSWYHGTLEYLRLLDLVISPAAHRDFFVSRIQALAEDRSFRSILISGAGDCSMMIQVLNGFGAAAVEPDITVLDRCGTPLALNRWLAEREGLSIEIIRSEILDFDTDRTFDLICTHCFLGYFTPDVRPALAAKWFSLLRPGGRLMTVNPIRDTPDYALVQFTPDQAASFVDRALKAAESRPDMMAVGLDWFRQRVRTYAANFGSFPVRSGDEFRGLFEAAGFTVEAMNLLHLLGTPTTPSTSGPTELGLKFMSMAAVRP